MVLHHTKNQNHIISEIYRILKPGRLMVCHTKDLAVYKNSSGYTGLYNFTKDHDTAVENVGFKYLNVLFNLSTS